MLLGKGESTDMKEPYLAPLAQLICFRRMAMAALDDYQDTMDLFNWGGGDIETGSGDIEVDPWG